MSDFDKTNNKLSDKELEDINAAGIYTDMSRYTSVATAIASKNEPGLPIIGTTNQYQLMMQKKKDEDYMQSLLIPAK